MWAIDIEQDIYSIVKAKVTSALSAEYPNLYFTMDDSVQTEPKFPTVYIHFISSIEQASELDSKEIKAILLSAQYEVTVSKAQGIRGAKIVASKVLEAFKDLRFEAISLPMFMNTSVDTKRMVGRCRRMIGSGDTWR